MNGAIIVVVLVSSSFNIYILTTLFKNFNGRFNIWDKVFKSALSKFCGRLPLKNLPSPLLNTSSHMSRRQCV